MNTIKNIIFLISAAANTFAMIDHGTGLSEAPSLRVLKKQEKDFNSLWNAAVLKKDISEVKNLLANGINPNIKSENNQTVLHLLSNAGGYGAPLRLFPEKIEIIKILVLAGANPHLSNDNNKTALHYAIKYDYPADIISLYQIYQSPLPLKKQSIKALAKKIAESSYTLKQAKKDLPAEVYDELAPLALNDYDRLWLASKKGDIPTIKKLMVHGINPNKTDPIGRNVLFNLIKDDHYLYPFAEKKALIQLLIDAGISPYMRPRITTSLWGNENTMEVAQKKMGDIVNVIPLLQQYQFPSLKQRALRKIGNQIIMGKLALEQAKQQIPQDLHAELDTYITQYKS